METAVLMKRELFGCEIKQNSKTEFFSATDLVKAGNKWRILNGLDQIKIEDWRNLKSTQDFIAELKQREGRDVYIPGRGRGVNTYVHPFIFIDIALWINPKLKIDVYEWLYDCLIKYRNKSGDSYKKMCGALFLTQSNKQYFSRDIQEIANIIKVECGVSDWQTASEGQLSLRDRIHENVSLLSDIIKNRDALISTAIRKAKESEGWGR